MLSTMISRREALSVVDRHVKSSNLRKHMIAVSAIMRGLAEELEEDPRLWELIGLLHDIDYEETVDNRDRHGTRSAEMLTGLLPEKGRHAIRAHNERTGVKAESRMDQALIAADAVSGLCIATALIMPGKRLSEVKVKSLKNKFKDKSFARSVDRGRIMCCAKIGVDFNSFLEISLKALQSVSKELGL